MKTVRLVRFAYSPIGVFGMLSIDGQQFSCFTVERPWVDANRDGISDRSVSCIPEGTYPLVPVRDEDTSVTTAGLGAYVVDKVPGRSGIMIHIANTMDDLEGCIGLGNVLGATKTLKSPFPRWSVLNSSTTYKVFMAIMKGEPGQLIVSFTTNRP